MVYVKGSLSILFLVYQYVKVLFVLILVVLSHKPDVQHQVNRLRDCITVLFVFHRQPIKDQEFVQNIRTWTQKMVRMSILHILILILVHLN